MYTVLVEAVAKHVVDRCMRAIDRNLAEIRPTQTAQLGVQIGEEPGLQQRIVGDVDAGHQMSGMERHLFGFCEVVGGVAIQLHRSDDLNRRELFGHHLRGVEQVDSLEHLVRGIRHHLHAEIPLGVGALLDRVGQVAAMQIGIHPGRDLCLFPHQGVHAELWLPVELHQRRRTIGAGQPEGVDTETLHHPVRPRNASVGHVPHGVRLGLGVQRHEVPEGVVCALRLRDLAVRVRLGGMDDVGEFDAVLDEEDRDVVAHQVESALVGVELGGEATSVPHGVGRTAGTQHRRKAHEDIGFRTRSQKGRRADLLGGAVAAEHTVRRRAAGVHRTLGNALVVEMGDLLSQVVIL